MLDKSKHFRKTLGGFEWSGKHQFDFPKATPQQIQEIKEKIQKENRIRNAKLCVVLIIISIISIMLILSL